MTKRRKVWVNMYPGEAHSWAHWTKRGATKAAMKDVRRLAVPFVESRHGDVVLSREEVARLRDLAWTLAGDHRRAMLALLRGGR